MTILRLPSWRDGTGIILEGFFDTYGGRTRLLVTGSSRLDVYRRGGDSLMGRYLSYRMHPFTVAELIDSRLSDAHRIVRQPGTIPASEWTAHSGNQVIYSSLASVVGVSVNTLRRWVSTLAGFYLGFTLQPWFTSVARSLRKEPKWFLRDWSRVADAGKRSETFVACHLLKAVEGWTDLGLGDFRLVYLRDKEKREVDFVVIRDGRPWFLVEVKQSDTALHGPLTCSQRQLQAPHAFQVVIDADHVASDCFAQRGHPLVVPAQTFLSQLL